MRWCRSARKESAALGVNSHDHNGRTWVARRKDRTGMVVLLQGDSRQVRQCTTTKFRDELDEDQRWLKAELVMVAVAKACCCNEIGVDELYKCRDEQVKIVAAMHVSAPNATICGHSSRRNCSRG